ncbi:hypothetical protein, partial [Salmonella enterica]|uniref:hypothetical protein n=1 Tax=Salmonella enterica TaxID=28901 RepID=UPI003D648416
VSVAASQLSASWQNFGPTLEAHNIHAALKDGGELSIKRVTLAYQIGKTITVMANCERNGGSGAITVTININGQVKTAEVIPYTAGLPAMYQTVVFSVYTTSPVVDISVSLRVRGQYTTSASVWPLVMVSRSGNNFTN